MESIICLQRTPRRWVSMVDSQTSMISGSPALAYRTNASCRDAQMHAPMDATVAGRRNVLHAMKNGTTRTPKIPGLDPERRRARLGDASRRHALLRRESIARS